MQSNVEKISERRKKSVVLPADILSGYSDWLESMHTLRDAAEVIGIGPQALKMIKVRGTCSPETLEKIKTILNGSNQPA
jgi:hypothetical protein